MFKKSIYSILFFSLLFIGCGTDSTGGKFINSTTDEIEEEPIIVESTLRTGVFLDSSVSGINYKTSSGLNGKTDISGQYKYNKHDLIEFYIADISFGEIKAKELITTNDLPYSMQVAQFLQTIDSDNFTENGIQLHSKIHQNYLLQKDTIKDDNKSIFAQRLNIEDFDDSSLNAMFIEELMQSLAQEPRNIVTRDVAYKHTQKASNLQNIEKNNIVLYNDISNIEINASDINRTIQHKTLEERLIYNLYKKAYRAEILDNNQSNLNKSIVEILLYTANSFEVAKKRIINNVDNTNIESCLSTISFNEENKTKEAQKVIACSNINNNLKETSKEQRIAIAYLDLYLSCSPQDETCLLERFENNSSIDERLSYASTQAKVNETTILYGETKKIINNYINKISKLAKTASKGLPIDSFLNRIDISHIKRVVVEAKILELESKEENYLLWTSIDIYNRAGADINITSFEPKLIMGGKEITLAKEISNELNQTYPATSSTLGIKIPIFIDNKIKQEGSAELLLDIYYKANDATFQANSKTIINFDFDEL